MNRLAVKMRKGFPVAPFFLTVLLCGCVETIVMDPHEKDLPVAIHCVLTNPTNEVVIYNPASPVSTMQKQSMTIKYVKGKSSGDYIPVEDASVRIEASDSLKGSRRRQSASSTTRNTPCTWIFPEGGRYGRKPSASHR